MDEFNETKHRFFTKKSIGILLILIAVAICLYLFLSEIIYSVFYLVIPLVIWLVGLWLCFKGEKKDGQS